MFFNKNCHHFHIFFKFCCFCQLFSKEFEKTLKNPGFFIIHLKKTRKYPVIKTVFFKPGFITLPTLLHCPHPNLFKRKNFFSFDVRVRVRVRFQTIF